MRAIRLKIKPEVCELLLQVSKEFKTMDRGFTEDLYSLIRLKGNGIPSKERAEKLADFLAKKVGANPITARIMMNRRMQFFRQTVKMAYFKALVSMPNPIEAVHRLLLTFQKLYMKYREAQCLTCQFHSQCDFGQQYGNATTNIIKVIDPDFKKKVHEDCPVRPQISSVNQVVTAMAQWKKTVQEQKEEAEVAEVGVKEKSNAEKEAEEEVNELTTDDDLDETSLDENDSDYFILPDPQMGPAKFARGAAIYSGSHDGSQYVKAFEEMVNRLDKTHLTLFTIGQQIGMALLKDKKGKFKPTETLSNDKNTRKIKSESDIPFLVPSEHGLPQELFDEKLGKKALNRQQNLKTIQKKRILYLLVDNSGSMTTALCGNKYGMLSRGALASVFSIVLTKQVRDEKGIIFCRFFADGPGRRLYAKEYDDFAAVMQMQAHASFNGGSTHILAALDAAVKDIANAKKGEEISKSEIILITDCQDNFPPSEIQLILGKQEFNVLDISCTSSSFAYEGSRSLHKVAKTYYRVNPDNIDINKIVSLV